jgi:hypothetical protein
VRRASEGATGGIRWIPRPAGGRGILAVWNDCAPGSEGQYEAWYRGEHLPERVGIPGFRGGWRYRAIDAEPEYFTFYETDTPEVLGALAAAGLFDLPALISVVSAGAVVGDSIGYGLGRWLGRQWLVRRRARLGFHRDRIEVVDAFFERHGGKAVLIGRFPPLAGRRPPAAGGVAGEKKLPGGRRREPAHRADVRQASSLRASRRRTGTLVPLYFSAGLAG